MVISIILSFAGSLLLAVIFEATYAIITAHRPVPLTKPEAATVYWSLLVLLGFAAGGAIFMGHILVGCPAAVAHIQLSNRMPSRISCRQLLQQVGVLASQALGSLKTWCMGRWFGTS